MYKLVFFVPESHLEVVKELVFSVGAGKIGAYDQCCWQSKGIGQFRALAESQPFIGEKEVLELVEEYKVEMVCSDELIRQAIAALKSSHPYEEPAYEVYRLAEL